jgi:hypothetical protein
MIYDNQAKEIISLLKKEFNIIIEEKPSLISKYTIGTEIEVKFQYFFPDIFNKYFNNKKYENYTDNEKEIISNEISIQEKNILPLLEKTIELGIPKGNDPYWEFAFNPVNNLTLLYYQIEILKKANLIPTGEHSFHITIGGLKRDKKSYYILMILELLFLKQDRILSGYNYETYMNSTWAKKGRAGITIKNENDLIDCSEAIEFRTLMIYDDTDIYSMFKILHHLLHNDCKDLIDNVVNEMKKYNLPDKNWENIHRNMVIWNQYSESFNNLSKYTKDLFKIL